MTAPYDPASPLAGASRCPHCGAHARVLESDELRVVCGVCGAPRVVASDPGVTLSGREVGPLESAESARRKRFLWKLAAVFAGAIGGAGVLATMLLALLFGLAGTAFGAAAALPFIVVALVALGQARGKSAELTRAVGEAWKSAARDVVMQSKQGVTSEQLAAALAVSPAGAETLLTELAVEDAFRSEVTDDGRLIVAPGAALSLRIDTDAQGAGKTVVGETLVADSADPLEARFAELEESLAAEEQAAAEAAAAEQASVKKPPPR
jgi:hypothetical protein